MKQNDNSISTSTWKKLTLCKISATENNGKTVYNTFVFNDSNATDKRQKTLFIRLVSAVNDPKLQWLVANRSNVIRQIKTVCGVPATSDVDACIGTPFYANIEKRESNGYTNYNFITKDVENNILSTTEYSRRHADKRIAEKYSSLRYYQLDALSATLKSVDAGSNPVVVIPTGGGKTSVICSLCAERVNQGRVLCLAHRQELLRQTNESFQRFAPELLGRIGVYSAGLKRSEIDQPVTIAGIQTIGAGDNIKRVLQHGSISTIIIDEAHRVPRINESACSQYCKVIKEIQAENPDARIIGLSATPYRTSTGLLVDDDDQTSFFNDSAYEVGIKELIKEGYLSPLISRVPPLDVASTFHIVRGEFDEKEVEGAYTQEGIIKQSVESVLQCTSDRKSCLIFCVSIAHCKRIKEAIEKQGSVCGIITGESTQEERSATLEKFVNRQIKFLVNCDVLTTGFDAPNIDAVVLLRPILSPGLYAQMVGRGSRLYPDKKNCLVLDYGGNILRHGAIDRISPKRKGERTRDYLERVERTKQTQKVCKICFAVVEMNVGTCPDCGQDFGREVKNHTRPTNAAILSTDDSDVVKHVAEVDFATYGLRRSKGNNEVFSISYRCKDGSYINESLTFSSDKDSLNRFCQKKWRELTTAELPETPLNALCYARTGMLSIPASIEYHIDDRGYTVIDNMFDSDNNRMKPRQDTKYVNSGNFGYESAKHCQYCHESKNFIVVTDNGELVIYCQSCGSVIERDKTSNKDNAREKVKILMERRIPATSKITPLEIETFTKNRGDYFPTSQQKKLDSEARKFKYRPQN